MKNTLKTKKDTFMIQKCYFEDDVIMFNIGVKHNNTWLYESGSYYSFDNSLVFDNSERLKENMKVVQAKIETNKKAIILRLRNLLR